MSRDQNYLALTQIERGMENEISTFSSGDSRLETYLATMEHAPSLQINGALKVFSMLAGRDEQIGRYESADAAYTWMYALCRAKDSKLYHHMFPSIRYEEEIIPQFLKEASWSRELEMQESKEAWQMVTITTLICGALLAFSILLLHFNFVLSLLLILALYFYLVFYYCFWLRQRNVLIRLEALRENMSPTLQHFADSIPLQAHPLYPSFEDRMALRETLRTRSQIEKQERFSQREPERNINGLTKAEAKAQRKAKRHPQQTPTSSQIIAPSSKTKNKAKPTTPIVDTPVTPSVQPNISSGPRLSIFAEEEAKEKARQAQLEAARKAQEAKQAKPTPEPKAPKVSTKSSPSSKKGATSRPRSKQGLGHKRFPFFSSQKFQTQARSSTFLAQASNKTYNTRSQMSQMH